MYWNNELHEVHWPSDRNPMEEATHNGTHCLFYNPQAQFHNVTTNQRLADLVAWAQQWLDHDGIEGFCADSRNHYDIANLVKLNMWTADIKRQGIVKPWLLQDQGNGTFLAGTGDSRLRCLERLPHITTVPAFVSTHHSRAHLYQDLEPVHGFDRFAEICGARTGQLFLFRYTDSAAPYGLYWYEYNSDRTRSVTPGEAEAVAMFVAYVKANPDVIISESWFDHEVLWQHYRSSS